MPVLLLLADAQRLSHLSPAVDVGAAKLAYLQVVKAVTARIGADRVGLRLSPYGAFLHGSLDDEVEELVTYLVKELAKLKLVYLHCVEPRAQGHASVEPPPGQDLQKFRKVWPVRCLLQGAMAVCITVNVLSACKRYGEDCRTMMQPDQICVYLQKQLSCICSCSTYV